MHQHIEQIFNQIQKGCILISFASPLLKRKIDYQYVLQTRRRNMIKICSCSYVNKILSDKYSEMIHFLGSKEDFDYYLQQQRLKRP